ncbi:MAG: cob(I)yrinic acid a,c-diamide adenosyltransferase [Ignavibacteriales bacterium]|nr:cob(I)yrinic acid a,c-diamide adenosyltransferase [Ignavibacteriales bacterium]
MKIYTKTGDRGETSLIGGKRVTKDNLRIDAYGTIDELNSALGIAIIEIKNEALIKLLQKIQNQLFVVGSDLATPKSETSEKLNIAKITIDYYEGIEKEIDFFSTQLPELKNFILPGGSKGASYLHLVRTICRRAERIVVALSKSVDIGENIIIYLNRLSDLFFVLARYENKVLNIPDIIWKM